MRHGTLYFNLLGIRLFLSVGRHLRFTLVFAWMIFNPKQIISQFNFTNYDYRHGLPLVDVTCFAQDSNGYLWMGSTNGVVKFDGFHFEHFRGNLEGGGQLAGNDIAEIKVGHDGRIWIGTHENGLSIYDPVHHTFTNLFSRPRSNDEVNVEAIFTIAFDPEGDAWLGTAKGGIIRINHDSLTADFIQLDSIVSEYNCKDILRDPNNPAYFYASINNGLYRFHYKDVKLIKVSVDLDRVDETTCDHSGAIWIKPYWGSPIVSYHPHSQIIMNYEHGHEVRNTEILAAFENEIWVSTSGQGIQLFLPNVGIWKSILPKPFDPHSLPSRIVTGMFRDNADRIWIGTSEGISVLAPHKQNFENIRLFKPGTQDPLMVKYLIPDLPQEKALVSPYAYSDLLLMNNLSGELMPVGQKQSDPLHHPGPIFRFDEGFWVLFFNGLGIYNPSTNTLTRYNPPGYPEESNSNWYEDATMDQDGNLWIVKFDFTIIKINLKSRKFEIIQHEKNQSTHPRSIFCEDSTLWFGLTNGIARYVPYSNDWQYFTQDHPSFDMFESGLNHVAVDHDGFIWAATWRNAVYKFEYQEKELQLIQRYDISEGLANNRIEKFVIDSDGRLFAYTSSGFSMYDQLENRFTTWGRKDGIHSGWISGITFVDSTIYVCNKSGFSKTTLNSLDQQHTPPKVLFKYITVGDSLLIRDNLPTEIIRLDATRNDVSIEFIGLNFSDPESVSYRYRLEEKDAWTSANSHKRTISLPNIPPGNYNFEVQASLDKVQWGPSTHFRFQVIPPFWSMWWFQLVVMASLVSLVVFWNQKRVRLIRTKEAEKTAINAQFSELELKALRSQMNPHFMFNSLNSIKKYILRSKPSEAAQYLSSFAHLIRLTLHHSSEKTISLAQEVEMLMLYIELEKLRFRGGFEFNCTVDPLLDLDDIKIPPMILQPYIENSIWHGLIHRDDHAILSLIFKKVNQCVHCIIEDNGIGRQKAKELKSLSASQHKSMGMEITKNRIDILNSINSLGIKVEVIDKDPEIHGTGTKVILSIPL